MVISSGRRSFKVKGDYLRAEGNSYAPGGGNFALNYTYDYIVPNLTLSRLKPKVVVLLLIGNRDRL